MGMAIRSTHFGYVGYGDLGVRLVSVVHLIYR